MEHWNNQDRSNPWRSIWHGKRGGCRCRSLWTITCSELPQNLRKVKKRNISPKGLPLSRRRMPVSHLEEVGFQRNAIQPGVQRNLCPVTWEMVSTDCLHLTRMMATLEMTIKN